SFVAENSAILGNCALYGATGGKLLVSGRAGERFAVRNSGAITVVDAVGMHACGYMTGGIVVILGETSHNLGSGMTGGVLFTSEGNERFLSHEYLAAVPFSKDDEVLLRARLEEHAAATGSRTSRALSEDPSLLSARLKKYLPLALAASLGAAPDGDVS